MVRQYHLSCECSCPEPGQFHGRAVPGRRQRERLDRLVHLWPGPRHPPACCSLDRPTRPTAWATVIAVSSVPCALHRAGRALTETPVRPVSEQIIGNAAGTRHCGNHQWMDQIDTQSEKYPIGVAKNNHKNTQHQLPINKDISQLGRRFSPTTKMK